LETIDICENRTQKHLVAYNPSLSHVLSVGLLIRCLLRRTKLTARALTSGWVSRTMWKNWEKSGRPKCVAERSPVNRLRSAIFWKYFSQMYCTCVQIQCLTLVHAY